MHTSVPSATQEERTQSLHDVQTLKGELARRGEEFEYKHQLQRLTTQEQSAAARLSYERLLADKRSVDIRLEEIEARVAIFFAMASTEYII